MQARLVRVQDLQAGDRAAMYTLLHQHFEGIQPQVFQQDLAQKNWVLLLEDSQQIQGFSTLRLYETTFSGQSLGVVYSGDTIVDPSVWFSSVLPRAWIAGVNWLRRSIISDRLYWLLISSGFRTYRFLPTFWQEFFPCYETPTPGAIANLMQFLAQQQFGSAYDPSTGVVQFPQPQQLRPALRDIPPERLKDPHTAFFQAKNPGYFRGDELVCLTEISQANLTPAGKRMWDARIDLAVYPAPPTAGFTAVESNWG